MDTTTPRFRLFERFVTPRTIRLFGSGAPRQPVENYVVILSTLLNAVKTLAEDGGTGTARALMVRDDWWRRLSAQAVHELRRVGARLALIADGGSATFTIRDITLLTRFSADRIDDQQWHTSARWSDFEKHAHDALYYATVRRCQRCRGLFVTPRTRRGTRPRYCSATCRGTTATQRWRQAHRERFRALRRAAYKRRRERQLGRKVKIQRRRVGNADDKSKGRS